MPVKLVTRSKELIMKRALTAIAAAVLVSLTGANAADEKTAPQPTGTPAPAATNAPALPALKIEKLCAPVVTARMFSSGVAPNSRGGWSFIGQYLNYKSTSGPGKEKETIKLPGGEHYLAYKNLDVRPEGEWAIVDLASGKSCILRWPGFHAGASALAENGRRFFGVDYAHIYYYDPAEDTVKPMARIRESITAFRQLYKFVRGPDGLLYATVQTTSGTTSILRINPDTLEYKLVEQVGLPGRRSGLTYGYYLALDPPWAYVAVGQGNWELFAVNMETGEKKCLADVQGDGCRVTVAQGEEFCSAGISSKEKKETGFLIDGALVKLAPGKKPEGTPLNKKQYKQVAWKNTKPMDISKPPEINAEITGLIAGDGSSVVAWRPAGSTGEWKNVAYSIQNAEPVRIESLTALPDGSLFGNAYQYNGFFRYYPATQKLDYFGKGGPSGPRLANFGGKVYIDGYPNTVLHVYDPAKPWTATATSAGKGLDDNPKWLGTMGQGCTEAHFCRELLDGGNGRIYMMGLRERWSTGAGLGYYEPATNKFFGLGTANKEIEPLDLVVLPKAGRVVFSGAPAKGGDARLIVYDLDLKEIERLEIFPGQADGGQLFKSDSDTQFFGCLHDPKTKKSIFYRYDLTARKIVAQTDAPAAALEMLGPRPADGSWWCFAGGTLCELNPKNLEFTPRFMLEGGLNFPNWVGKDIYGTSGGALVRVKVP